jgi:hypothetical protein
MSYAPPAARGRAMPLGEAFPPQIPARILH